MENDNHEDGPVAPADLVVVGATYVHWKHGGEYFVAAVGKGNSDPFRGIDVVVYRPVDSGPGDRPYARTREDFTALVTREDGSVVRRFRRKPDEDRDVTNADRRTWARAALEAYMARKGVAEDQILDGELTCLLIDLLHLRAQIDPADDRTVRQLFELVERLYAEEARDDG